MTILSGCGSSKKNERIVLLNGQFSEVTILMQMAGLLIEKNTKLKVTYRDSMNTVAAAQAVRSKEVDIYVSYDGTLLTTILGNDPGDVPKGENLFNWTKVKAQKEKGLTLLEKFGFENTYALAVKQDFAKKHNIKTISDIAPFTKQLVFGAEHEFFDERGTMRFKPFNRHYNIEWKDGRSLEMGLKYAAIDSGNIDVTMVYSTDGLNKKSNLYVMEDDLSFFPEYNAAFMFRDTLFEEYKETAPNLKEVLSLLNGKIDNETMIGLNYAVDAEGAKPRDVARKFLVEKGLL
jgi:osmoprotectant transport system substrate-binding protein/osmoprotectant transport system permease protein